VIDLSRSAALPLSVPTRLDTDGDGFIDASTLGRSRTSPAASGRGTAAVGCSPACLRAPTAGAAVELRAS
jgi:hypothetical protein